MRTEITLKRPITSISLDLDEASFDGYSLMRWIPVTEREPEYGNYIITFRDKRTGKIGVTVDYFCEFGWFDDGEYFETIAWMPLPEPWRGGANDQT